MNKKCYVCGLVNFAENASCRRCGTEFKSPDYLKKDAEPWFSPPPGFTDPKYKELLNDPVALGTLNGIGTGFRSWSHNPDGTSEAIVWFCFLYLPVFPITQYKLIILTDLEQEAKISTGQILQGLSPVKTLSTEYDILGKCAVDSDRVIKTYIFSYLLMPVFLFFPFFLFTWVGTAAKHSYGEGSVQELVCLFGFVIWFAIDLVVLAQMLHRSRGGKKG